ncbi:hypothetical protein D9758_015713 [Tetrapyrgos nigripes]|uniref:Uncharacterized protein n=1 Tax=Tetrapyrgos nigripes TaxID=182062 RepID=A0A8H5CAS0_9AGAR|nr:hypothetical protein D9758_015713 [Tetrapyrgos nigripes]
MAAPSDFTMDNISGKFSMNKSISDSCDEMWKLQGSSWMARKAAGFAGVTFLFDRHTDSTNVENLDITPIITGGIKAPRDLRVLDFSEKPMENALTGPYFVRTRKVRLSQEKDGEDEFLGKGKCEVQKKERWLEDAVIHARIESTKNGWTLDEASYGLLFEL